MSNRPDDIENTVPVPPGNKPKPLGGWVCPQCGLRLNASNSVCPQDGTRIEHAGIGQIDQALADRYEFIESVGSGGMSVIYKAKQRLLDRIVAIKMLHSHVLDDQTMMRFQQEAKAATSLQHRNVIKVHDFGVSEHGQPYMVMDFIDGPTLTELIGYRGSLPLPEAIEIMTQVCEALEHAHMHGVLHRDLKPGNIMLMETKDGWDVRIVDFGIAKIIESADSVAHQLTRTGELFGSPMYMCPEQCMSRQVDQRGDIYSFGCILYELLVGAPPHRGETLIETIFKHLNEQAKTLHQARPDIVIPDAVDEFVMKLIATKPEERYQTMSEVKQHLKTIQGGALGSWFGTRSKFKWKWKLSKSTTIMIAGSVLACIGVASLLYSLFALQQVKKQEPELHTVNRTQRKLATSVPSTAPFSLQSMHDVIPPNKVSSYYLDVLKFSPHDLWTDKNLRPLFMSVSQPIVSLDLSNSKITNLTMEPVSHLIGLKELSLNDTFITEAGLGMAGSIESLEELDLSGIPAKAHGYSLLSNLKNLERLNVNRTQVDDAALATLSALPKLEELDLRLTSISNKGLAHLAKAPALERLDLSGTTINDQGLEAIRKLKLTELNISDTEVTGRGLFALKEMTTLQDLNVAHIVLKDSDLSALANLPNLYTIDLSSTSVDDYGIEQLAHCPNLTNIQLKETRITDGAAKILKGMEKLETLNLERNRVSDKLVKEISSLPNLKHFSLNDDRITDASPDALTAVTSLRQLDLSGTQVSNKGLLQLASLKNLKDLSLWGCARITNRGLFRFQNLKPKCHVQPKIY